MSSRVPFVERLVIRLEPIEPGQVPPAPPPGDVAYRTMDGLGVCALHANELRSYMPGAEFRRILSDDEIDSFVTEFGLHRADLLRLHAKRLCETCIMCETIENLESVCDSCAKLLHPRWPAVYCSTNCALDDA